MNNISPDRFGLSAQGARLPSHTSDPELSAKRRAITHSISQADTIVASGPDYYGFRVGVPEPFQPLFAAVLDSGVGVLFVGRDTRPRLFRADEMRGIVAIIGDDRRRYRHRIDGPKKYDRPTILNLLGSASLVCAHWGVFADRKYYATLAQTAAAGDVAVAVRTWQPMQAHHWIEFIKRHSPQSRHIFVGTGGSQTRFGPGEEALERKKRN